VIVGCWAFIKFVHGKLAMVGGMTASTAMWPPFAIVEGIRGGCEGFNRIGLRRSGASQIARPGWCPELKQLQEVWERCTAAIRCWCKALAAHPPRPTCCSAPKSSAAFLGGLITRKDGGGPPAPPNADGQARLLISTGEGVRGSPGGMLIQAPPCRSRPARTAAGDPWP